MRGLAEVSTLANGSQMPSAGIFDPPYAINVNLTQLPIATKVSCPIQDLDHNHLPMC